MPFRDPEMKRAYMRVYDATRRDPDKERDRQRRRVRLSAGGVSFFIGRAPTVEDALRLRKKIREEAPRATNS